MINNILKICLYVFLIVTSIISVIAFALIVNNKNCKNNFKKMNKIRTQSGQDKNPNLLIYGAKRVTENDIIKFIGQILLYKNNKAQPHKFFNSWTVVDKVIYCSEKNIYIAVGYYNIDNKSYVGKIAYSNDYMNWYDGTINQPSEMNTSFVSVIYNKKSKQFVALCGNSVDNNTKIVTFTSSHGKNWNEQKSTTIKNLSDDFINDLCYADDKQLYVVITSSKILYSTDLLNWKLSDTSKLTLNETNKIYYIKGKFFVVGDDFVNYPLIYSDDGIKWKQPKGFDPNSFNNTGKGFAYSPELNKYLVCGNIAPSSGVFGFATSKDGINWSTNGKLPDLNYQNLNFLFVSDVIWDSNTQKFYATAYFNKVENNQFENFNFIISSDDGINWAENQKIDFGSGYASGMLAIS